MQAALLWCRFCDSLIWLGTNSLQRIIPSLIVFLVCHAPLLISPHSLSLPHHNDPLLIRLMQAPNTQSLCYAAELEQWQELGVQVCCVPQPGEELYNNYITI